MRLVDGPGMQKETVKVASKTNTIRYLNTDEYIPDGGIIPHVLSMGMQSWSPR